MVSCDVQYPTLKLTICTCIIVGLQASCESFDWLPCSHMNEIYVGVRNDAWSLCAYWEGKLNVLMSVQYCIPRSRCGQVRSLNHGNIQVACCAGIKTGTLVASHDPAYCWLQPMYILPSSFDISRHFCWDFPWQFYDVHLVCSACKLWQTGRWRHGKLNPKNGYGLILPTNWNLSLLSMSLNATKAKVSIKCSKMTLARSKSTVAGSNIIDAKSRMQEYARNISRTSAREAMTVPPA